jgi:hypothetical protein
MSDQHFTRHVLEDPENPGEFYIDLGDEICDSLGWQVGDTLEWSKNEDGTWTITKKQTP